MVKTKLVDLAVMSAMKRIARKTLSEEEALNVMESNELTISYRGGDDVFRIKLRQGEVLIEPASMKRPEMGGKDPKEHAVFFHGKLSVFKTRSGCESYDYGYKGFWRRKKYEVDFSRIK